MSSILKVDTIQDQAGNNIINENSNTITIGASGDTVNIVGTLQNNGSALTGDISSVVAGTGLSGGGTSGDVTLNIEAAQPTITSTGTLTGFTSTGINDDGTSTAITIDSSNDVGIGTNSPGSYRLNVTDTANTNIRVTESTNNIFVDLRANTTGGLLRTASNHPFVFGVNQNEIMRLTSTGLGIGTTSPAQKLHISSGGTTYLRTENTGTSTVTDFGTDATGSIVINRSAKPFRIFTDSTERVRVDSSGKVGIGTSSPSSKLTVSDANTSFIYVEENTGDSGDTAGILFKTSASNGFFKSGMILEDDGTTYARGKLHIVQNSTADDSNATVSDSVVTILNDGKVGIGTTAPSTTLDIRSASPVISTVDTGDSNAVAQIDGNAGWLQLKADNNNTLSGTNITFSVDGSEKARIDSSGNLMVGTTSVQGGTAKTLQIADSGSARLLLQNTGGGRTYGFFTPTSGEFGLFDYTASATRLTFNTSGTLLIGRTDTTATNTGLELEGTGTIVSRRDGNVCMFLDRKTSDGTILEFRKDNSTVGIVFSSGGIQSGIGDGNTAVLFADNISSILPWQTDNNARDAGIDLGRSATRFKDIYLSGGAFLGGTGSANKLDDYEEGTWTPSLDSIGSSNASGDYTKIGNVCTAKFKISSDGSGSNINITGFPFTSDSGFEQQGLARETQTSGKLYFIRVAASATTGTIIRYDASSSIGSNDTFEGQITYITNT